MDFKPLVVVTLVVWCQALADKRMLLDGQEVDVVATIHQLTQRMAALEKANRPVAFKTHLKTSYPSLGTNQHVVYEEVLLNLGNAYNSHHGTFTAPGNGTYMFSVHACSQKGHWIVLDLVRNTNQVLGKIYAGDPAYENCSSETTVVQLQAGDDVYVTHSGSSGDFLYTEPTYGYNTFTGALIQSL